MEKRETCPLCGAGLEDPEHPGYWLTVGVEIQGEYDGVLFWSCPFCKGAWNRWPDTEYYRRIHDRAQRYVEQRNAGKKSRSHE